MTSFTSVNYWQVDAFATQQFQGNPAGIFILHQQLDDSKMQALAKEVNMPISTFVCFHREDESSDSSVSVCWFTPFGEIFLCGHGTLAASHVFFSELQPTKDVFTFNTKKSGIIKVTRKEEGYYQMSFPGIARTEIDIESIQDVVAVVSPGRNPASAFQSEQRLLLVYSDETQVSEAQFDTQELFNTYKGTTIIHSSITQQLITTSTTPLLQYLLLLMIYCFLVWICFVPDMVIMTSLPSDGSDKFKDFDFISRVFHSGVEDAVCGSAHCSTGIYLCDRHHLYIHHPSTIFTPYDI